MSEVQVILGYEMSILGNNLNVQLRVLNLGLITQNPEMSSSNDYNIC